MGGGALARPLRRVPFAAGLACIALAALGMGHFAVSAALAGFPEQVLGAAWNWIFVGAHAALGCAGIALLGVSRRGKALTHGR